MRKSSRAQTVDEDENAPVQAVELLSTKVRCLNFVLVGNVRSGTHGLQSALTRLPKVVCHEALLHQNASVSAKSHVRYFGAVTPVFDRGNCGAPVYLDARVFDKPLRGEQAIGVRATYDQIADDDLVDYFSTRQAEGDFCVIHVRRNPLICLVSQKQAELSGLWSAKPHEVARHSIPRAVTLTVDEVVEFVRRSVAIQNKIAEKLPDRFEIPYLSLYADWQRNIEKICAFLELEFPLWIPQPACARLRNRNPTARIANYDALLKQLPMDVFDEITSSPLF